MTYEYEVSSVQKMWEVARSLGTPVAMTHPEYQILRVPLETGDTVYVCLPKQKP